MTGFSDETREAMLAVCNGYCAVPLCVEKATSCHHKLPNTIYNSKHFSLFINSPMNCFPTCEFHHANYADKKISRKEAEIFEKFLQELQCEVPF